MAKYERATVHVSNILTDAVPEINDLLTTELVDQGVAVCFYQEPGYEPKSVEAVEEPVEAKKVAKKSVKGSKIKRVG
jgi:ABC-type Zn2+ transport system substrate-binding protein/surface adhesin